MMKTCRTSTSHAAILIASYSLTANGLILMHISLLLLQLMIKANIGPRLGRNTDSTHVCSKSHVVLHAEWIGPMMFLNYTLPDLRSSRCRLHSTLPSTAYPQLCILRSARPAIFLDLQLMSLYDVPDGSL
jgi:hypothetical protein